MALTMTDLTSSRPMEKTLAVLVTHGASGTMGEDQQWFATCRKAADQSDISVTKRSLQLKIILLQDEFRIKAFRAIGKDGDIVIREFNAQGGPVIATFRF